jgi:hypothetical protein
MARTGKVNELITEYFAFMEGVHIKDALKTAMAITRIGTIFISSSSSISIKYTSF